MPPFALSQAGGLIGSPSKKGASRVTVLFVAALATVSATFMGCGGGGSSSSLSAPPPAPAAQAITINSVSNTSPMPLTPIQVNTSGFNSAAAVVAQFSDNSGYSVQEIPIRIVSGSTIVIAVPLYVSPASRQIGPGSVSLVLIQGNQSSNAVNINIQDLPSLSTYGVQPGQISHAMLVFQAMLVARRLNEFQAVQAATGSQVDTTQAQGNLSTLLSATIQARSDIDRVSADNTVVIPEGVLPDGNQLQFDEPTLELMDRIQAVYLSETFGTAVAGVAARAQAARSLTTSTMRLPAAKPVSGPHQIPDSTRAQNVTSYGAAGSLPSILQFMEGMNNLHDITEAVQLSNSQDLLDQMKALGDGIGVVNSLVTDNVQFGMVSALLSTVDTTVHCWGDVGAWLIAEAVGNQGAAAQAVQDMQTIPLQDELQALQNLALAPFEEAQLVANTSTVLNFVENTAEFFNQNSGQAPAEQDWTTQLNVAATDSGEFASSTQGIGEVEGNASLITNLGTQAPDSGVELSPGPGNETITTLADPSGNYEMFIPLGVSGFAYSSSDFFIFDPVGGSVLGSEVVNLSAAAVSTPVQLPAMQATCNDTDIDAPDSDDPDCD